MNKLRRVPPHRNAPCPTQSGAPDPTPGTAPTSVSCQPGCVPGLLNLICSWMEKGWWPISRHFRPGPPSATETDVASMGCTRQLEAEGKTRQHFVADPAPPRSACAAERQGRTGNFDRQIATTTKLPFTHQRPGTLTSLHTHEAGTRRLRRHF